MALFTPGGASLEAITEIGTAFVDQVIERLDEKPDLKASMDGRGEACRRSEGAGSLVVDDLRRRCSRLIEEELLLHDFMWRRLLDE